MKIKKGIVIGAAFLSFVCGSATATITTTPCECEGCYFWTHEGAPYRVCNTNGSIVFYSIGSAFAHSIFQLKSQSTSPPPISDTSQKYYELHNVWECCKPGHPLN